MVKHVTNTAHEDEDNRVLNGLEMLVFGHSFIERQERQGQTEAVESTTLPTPDAKTRAQYEALGFVFGESVPGDELFCAVTLPTGWKKQRTEHSMHNDIVDAAGNARGSFFYKAAFYDRKADLYPPNIRYRVREHYNNGPRTEDSYDRHKVVHYEVIDEANAGAVLYAISRTVTALPPSKGGDHSAFWAERQELATQTFGECKTWLSEHFPDWTDPAAYWPAG